VTLPILIAHRGASQDAPENTLAAIELGWLQQADAVEVDIRLTRDHHIVLMHDATACRTAGLNQPIAELMLGQLRALDAGIWKAPQWSGECVPTLAEALDSVPADKRIFIEIKCGPEVLPELESVLLTSSLPTENIVLIGFGEETMREAKRRLPGTSCLLLSDFRQDDSSGAWSPTIEDLIQRAQSANLDGLDLRAQPPLDRAAIRQIHAAGLKVYAWTVNDAETALELVQAGIGGITTDCPGALREVLSEFVVR
jgi:glycerophosphoryl diester phosphodiesterase